jgi:hypothetical protein
VGDVRRRAASAARDPAAEQPVRACAALTADTWHVASSAADRGARTTTRDASPDAYTLMLASSATQTE